jgi:nicotinamide-nucleotide amidase
VTGDRVTDEAAALARGVHDLLLRSGASLATAESLTGGLIGAALTTVPGVSATYRGGVIAYATDLKAALLGVDDQLLARVGAVDPEVAVAMARGVRRRCASSYGLAATGVAGPDPQDGHPPGTVHVAVAGPGGDVVRSHRFRGGRAAIRAASVVAAFMLLREQLGFDPEQGRES